ncbi:methyl-accepting chemotaxis protein [Vibrio sonorensis]|uniref:methyl-accepting chemotaxis protein n=1 Tax=Vibrio sonorensis TaxID=1004316 RepID=UPI0008DAAE36|nr:methyl-accepting chemotaxis protein [Vibrio sonorensis]
MKKLDFKKSLLISFALLVTISVSLSSYYSYIKQRDLLHSHIREDGEKDTFTQAKLIESRLVEKIQGLNKLGQRYESSDIQGSEQELIELTHQIAASMNLNSSVVAFTNGDAYWNQTAKKWPNHKLIDDVTSRSWYQFGRESDVADVTAPYLGEESEIMWISIVRKTLSGMISVDMELSFLSTLISEQSQKEGSNAFVVDNNGVILASSSPLLKVGGHIGDTDYSQLVSSAFGKPSYHERLTVSHQDQMFFSHEITLGSKNWYYITSLDSNTQLQPLEEVRNQALLSTALAAALSSIFAFALLQMLYRPITAIKHMILGLSQGNGDLTQRLPVTSNDDLGQICHGVNEFISHLHRIVSDIRRASRTLTECANTMNSKSAESSNKLEHHVLETEQVVTAIEEMSLTANSMSSDAEQTAERIHEAHMAGKRSQGAVDEARSSINELKLRVQETVDNVDVMSKESENITSILSVITDIAEQTNLLALNAAIEAARAGEQGRGFAVVADEVRNLAKRTKDSTGEISVALERLTLGNRSLVESIGITMTHCEETERSTSNVTNELEQMIMSVSSINDLSTQIATSSQEQSSVTLDLSSNMNNISSIVHELNENAKGSLVSANEITINNQKLDDIVALFKL